MSFIDDCNNLVGKELMTINGMVYSCSAIRAIMDENVFALVSVCLNKNKAKRMGVRGNLNRGYEVWIMRLDKREEPYANKWNVRFPCNEDFGSYGWSYQNKSSAEKKMKELISTMENKQEVSA